MLCPHCGAQAPEGARFCGRCGRALSAERPLRPCPYCGQSIDADQSYCPHCDQPVTSAEPPPWEPSSGPEADVPTSEPRSGPAILAWVLVAAALVIILVSGFVIAYAVSPRVEQFVTSLIAPQPTAMVTPEGSAEIESEPTTAPSDEPPPTANPSPPTASTGPASVTPTPSPSATSPPSAADGGLESTFVADITVPDGTELEAGSQFIKTWRVRNSGDIAWPPGTHLRHVEGESFGVSLGDTVGPVEPDQEIDVSLTLTAPEEPGNYRGAWQLHTDEDSPFGTRLIAVISVPGPEVAVTPSPVASQQVTLIYEFGWAGGWMGITNQGKWATASNGRAYSAEMGLLDTPAMRAALAEMIPNGWRLKIMVRPALTYEGWTMGCGEAICQAHTSNAGQQLIINHVYMNDATWTSFLDDWLAGGSQRVAQNEHYAALQKAVFAPLNETPTVSCIGFRFVAAD